MRDDDDSTPGGPILVGRDGRSGGEDALALAELLAGEAEAPIAVTAEARAAADELIDAAATAGASLMVIGSSHRGAVGRIRPGAVGNRLLRGCPCPLAIAPAGFATTYARGLNVIGVAYDGSAESRAAFDLAVALAARFDAGLRLFSVVDDPQFAAAHWAGVAPVSPPDEHQIEELHERVDRRLAEAIGRVPAPIQAMGETLKGHPAETLIDASGRVDLLAIGSRGYGPLKRVLVGGVSGPVVRGAQCPVLVAPRSARPDAGSESTRSTSLAEVL
jgi:nucleotide-binding universal stress UspA family protein